MFLLIVRCSRFSPTKPRASPKQLLRWMPAQLWKSAPRAALPMRSVFRPGRSKRFGSCLRQGRPRSPGARRRSATFPIHSRLFRSIRGPDFGGGFALEPLVKRRILRRVEFGHEIDAAPVLNPADGSDEFFVIDGFWIFLVFHREGDGTPLAAFAAHDRDFVKVGGDGHMVFADCFDREMPGGGAWIILFRIVEQGTGDDEGSTAAGRPAANHLLELF